jgi:ketosteroid isomerase-like protein
MAAGSSGDLGYAVGIERGRVTVTGSDGPQEMVLRVTQVFRREDGTWRLVHRHADPVTSVTQATAVVAGGAVR